MKELVTSTGEKHGLINTLASSCPDTAFKHMSPENKVKAEKMKKEDEKVVRARYLNSRGPTERLEKPYMRWEGQPITMWRLIHGEVYDLPYGFVKEINESPGLAKRSELLDSRGIATAKDGQAERIHNLVPVSF